jgi:hypothetical protein
MWFQTLHVFFVVRHFNREILHVVVTPCPTVEWTAQQIIECCAWRRNSVVRWSNIKIKKLVKCELVHTRSMEWGSALIAFGVVSLSAVKRLKKLS